MALGWATVEEETPGRRARKWYTITPAGRVALADWPPTHTTRER
ncbi:MAG: helix-turn-helix transcriptional regulator [Actinomycetota bacterium]|nr:helix-turn-helix transcriptional regulator [Actinomycetota bacterium]